jgi:hypothetical protein
VPLLQVSLAPNRHLGCRFTFSHSQLPRWIFDMEILISSGNNFIWIRVESPLPTINETSGFKCALRRLSMAAPWKSLMQGFSDERSSTHDSQQRVELWYLHNSDSNLRGGETGLTRGLAFSSRVRSVQKGLVGASERPSTFYPMEVQCQNCPIRRAVKWRTSCCLNGQPHKLTAHGECPTAS